MLKQKGSRFRFWVTARQGPKGGLCANSDRTIQLDNMFGSREIVLPTGGLLIPIEEADQLIAGTRATVLTHDFEEVPLSAALGRILDEEIVADRAYPPFDRVAMDGIAIQALQYLRGRRTFKIERVVQAGESQKTLEVPENCLEVMTGAALPRQTDTVIPYERVTLEAGRAVVGELDMTLGQNVHLTGSDCAANAPLLRAGVKLGAPHLAVAAAVGKPRVRVRARPRIVLVSTGNELVAPEVVPEAHQIRMSNVFALQGLFNSFGFEVTRTVHLSDHLPEMQRHLAELLASCDVLVLSGGVSMGKFDFVPRALAALKVREIFHKVSQKPGKPVWFGQGEKAQIVFGLPGNPVSSLICARRFVIQALQQWCGEPLTATPKARLGAPVKFKKAMTLLQPVKYSLSEGVATPLDGNGSGDFISLSDSDGFVELPADQEEFRVGEVFSLYLWNGR